jgi:hypothetical protein
MKTAGIFSFAIMAGVALSLTAQQAKPAAPTAPAPPHAPIVEITAESATGEAAVVLALDRKIGQAMISRDRKFWDSVTASDFSMTHGSAWTSGGLPTQQDTKASFGDKVTAQQYKVYELGPVKVEMHATVALVYGHYIASIPASATRPANMAWFSCWFEHLYEKQNGKWKYLSHRTISGPVYGPTRESVLNK